MIKFQWARLPRLALAWLFMGLAASCGSPQNQDCGFEVASILNGENAPAQLSEWDCRRQNDFFTFALFANGTGTHSALGNFTWQDRGCGDYAYYTAFGSGRTSDSTLTVESGQLDYADGFEGQFSKVFCTLDETPDGVSF